VSNTYYPKAKEVTGKWYLVDVGGEVLGRSATKIAKLLLGKNEPTFTKGVLSNNKVVVINAAKVAVTGNKLTDKIYYRHSNYPGGLRSERLEEVMAKDARKVIQRAVKGMLPRNKLRKKYLANLYVYTDEKHPHQGQIKG